MSKIPVYTLLVVCALGALAADPLPDSDALLERIRTTWTGVAVRMNATMTITKPDGEQTSCKLRIHRAGDDRTRVQFLSPERHEGKVMLMAERKLWLYLPRAKKVTQVPRRRDPFGLSSLFNDLVFDESEISSAEVTDIREGYQLELRYHREKVHGPTRILFDRTTLLPVRCDFFSPSERPLRSVIIDDRGMWRGTALPESIRVLGTSRKWKEVRLDVEEFGEMTAEDMEKCSLEALGGDE
jgi:outer membrane lipoprotein-sorting protein